MAACSKEELPISSSELASNDPSSVSAEKSYSFHNLVVSVGDALPFASNDLVTHTVYTVQSGQKYVSVFASNKFYSPARCFFESGSNGEGITFNNSHSYTIVVRPDNQNTVRYKLELYEKFSNGNSVLKKSTSFSSIEQDLTVYRPLIGSNSTAYFKIVTETTASTQQFFKVDKFDNTPYGPNGLRLTATFDYGNYDMYKFSWWPVPYMYSQYYQLYRLHPVTGARTQIGYGNIGNLQEFCGVTVTEEHYYNFSLVTSFFLGATGSGTPRSSNYFDFFTSPDSYTGPEDDIIYPLN